MQEDTQTKQPTPTITLGIVKDGVIVPNIPLPERAWCRIEVQGVPLEVEPELEEEFQAHQLAAAQSLALVERLAEEMEANEKR